MGLAGLGIATYKDEEGEDYTINATLGRTSIPIFPCWINCTSPRSPERWCRSVSSHRYSSNAPCPPSNTTTEPLHHHHQLHRKATTPPEVTGRVLDGMKTLNLPEKFSYMAAGKWKQRGKFRRTRHHHP